MHHPPPTLLNTLLQWTDSFLTLDDNFGRPPHWWLARLLARAFLCRLPEVALISAKEMVPQAHTPELFTYVYIISTMDFFAAYQTDQDPQWLRAFIHIYRDNGGDPAETSNRIIEIFEEPDLQKLNFDLERVLALPQPRLAIPTNFNPLKITIRPLDIASFNERETEDVEMEDLVTYEPRVLPQPMPAICITNEGIEIQ